MLHNKYGKQAFKVASMLMYVQYDVCMRRCRFLREKPTIKTKCLVMIQSYLIESNK